MKPQTGPAAALIAVLLSACAGTSGTPATASSDEAGTKAVVIESFAYSPEELNIATGTSVEWINRDDILHTVTSGIAKQQGVPGVSKGKDARPDGAFDEELELDDSYTFTFDETGRYEYYCDIHSGMRAVIIVE